MLLDALDENVIFCVAHSRHWMAVFSDVFNRSRAIESSLGHLLKHVQPGSGMALPANVSSRFEGAWFEENEGQLRQGVPQ